MMDSISARPMFFVLSGAQGDKNNEEFCFNTMGVPPKRELKQVYFDGNSNWQIVPLIKLSGDRIIFAFTALREMKRRKRT